MKRILSLLLVLMLISASAGAKSPVWKVSKGDDYLFLGGTIHVLSKNDYPLPNAFEKAYAASEDIVLETNEAALSAPELQAEILKVMTFQDHRSLSTVLNREVYQAFKELLASKDIPIAVFEKFTPSGATLALTGIELQRLGLMDGNGVDMHFAKRAKNDQKEAIFLETVDQQIGFIKAMNNLDPNMVIESGIRDIKSFEATWQNLQLAWRRGDLEALTELGIVEMQRDYPSVYQTILVKRNKEWFSKVTKMIQTTEVEFMLVGALHMAGKDGLISMLNKAGYKIEQLN